MKKEEEIIESKNASELYSSADLEFKEQPQLIETLIKPDGAEAMEVVADGDGVEEEEGSKKKGVGIEVVQNVPEYFYMNEPLDNKGRWLESLMERAKSDDIPYTSEETENANEEEEEDVLSRTTRFNMPIQDDVWAFGRICYEEPEENGIPPKMTPVNTLLQGPLSIGSPRVKIILSK